MVRDTGLDVEPGRRRQVGIVFLWHFFAAELGAEFGVQRLVVQRAHDLEEGELQAHGVVDEADLGVGTLSVGGFVEDAVFAVAARRGGAGLAVELGVLAAGSVIEFGDGHRLIPPPWEVS